MRYNRPVVLAVSALIVGVAAFAFYFGPPKSVFPAPSEPKVAGAVNAILGSRSVHSPKAAANQVTAASDDMTVRSFGPMPECGDPVAMSAVVGMLREHTTVRTLGLAGAHDTQAAKEANPSTRKCDAQVQIEDGEYPIHYTISRYPSSGDGWEITASTMQF